MSACIDIAPGFRVIIRRLFVLAALAAAPAGHGQETPPAPGILSEESAPQAEVTALQAEVALFETIRKGIVLSLAQCELAESCTLTVNREELQRLLDVVTERIDLLAQRHSESGDAALEPLLIAYADARDGFTQALEKLASIAPAEPAAAEAAALGAEPAIGEEGAAAAKLPAEYDVFQDAGEDLFDDAGEELTDDEPVPEAAEE